eukprot:1456932-Pyramimonas_sp.AAC.1
MVSESPQGVDDVEWKSALTLSLPGLAMWLRRCREYFLAKYAILRNARKKGQVNLRQFCKELRKPGQQTKVSMALCH